MESSNVALAGEKIGATAKGCVGRVALQFQKRKYPGGHRDDGHADGACRTDVGRRISEDQQGSIRQDLIGEGDRILKYSLPSLMGIRKRSECEVIPQCGGAKFDPSDGLEI